METKKLLISTPRDFKYSATYYRRLKLERKKKKKSHKILEPSVTVTDIELPSTSKEICFTSKEVPAESSDSDKYSNKYDSDPEPENDMDIDISSTNKITPDYTTDEISVGQKIKEPLRCWALECKIPHTSVNRLLEILLTGGLTDLPRDSRTLLQTPKIVIIKPMGTGQFWYYGVKECLHTMLFDIDQCIEVHLNFHVDGLPINASSKHQFWPILLNIASLSNIPPQVVAIYYGTSKPPSALLFLEQFAEELNQLLVLGILIDKYQVTIKINSFICDTPARCFIKCIVPFNAYHSCNKCTVTGEYYQAGRHMSFPQTDCPLRTDDNFRSKRDPEHHQKSLDDEFIISSIEKLPIDLIRDIPIADSLHLLDLGLMKRCLKGWIFGSFNFSTKLFVQQVKDMSKWLVKCNSRMPSEIHRAVREFDCLSFWKATEYRTFLLYLGPVILKDNLSSEMYGHFLLLFCSVTICSSDYYTNQSNLLLLAEQLFKDYIEGFISNYGIDAISSNVHNLCHVVEDVRRFGALPNISSYPFENALGRIKSFLRSGNRPLAQIAKRTLELSKRSMAQPKPLTFPFLQYKIFDADHGPSNFQKVKLSESFTLQTNTKDQWFLTQHDEIIQMTSAQMSKDKIIIFGRRLTKLKSFFEYPFQSKYLNIYLSTGSLMEPLSYKALDIKCKMVSLEYNDQFVFLPLIHTLDWLKK